jgi:hypothetical protein
LAAQLPVGVGLELVVFVLEAEVARVVVVGAVVALLVVVDVLLVVVVGLGPETAKADCKMGM